ncbi:MAG: alpha/beta hydrolase fold protein [Bradyrhizobium sp.]|nr:alpha/beta hydrolase fold protein [Bradyrhizobium sp.]
MTDGSDDVKRTSLSGVDLEYIDRGEGRPILFLHPWIGLSKDLPALAALAGHGRVIACWHPGFARSSLPRHFSTVDDLAYFYLDLLDHLELDDCLVVGVSFGAWVAAEIAIKSCARISALVLADPVGIKVGGSEDAHIVDHFSIDHEDFARLAYADPALGRIDVAQLDDEEAQIIACNRDATALFGWMPYMYDPKLGDRLHRIKVPTLVMKGERDQIISDAYVARFAELLPNSQLETIADAGHFPHIEQPELFVEQVIAFSKRARV